MYSRARSIGSFRWTNNSVRAFAGGEDPVHAIEKRVRQTVLDALDRGWSGPPFDPIKLAERVHVPVAPTQDVPDARTVPSGAKILIEFNPTKSRGRVRFSIAHEIVHTFFPDCAERVRHRGVHSGAIADDWQLEMLCNVGAAEIIMPIGSFPELRRTILNIDELLRIRASYDVSMEALLIRIAHLSKFPLAVFCASRDKLSQQTENMRLDYLISSASWRSSTAGEFKIPTNSVIGQCAAIGYTVKNIESWGQAGRVRVECVGLPPYPGSSYLRVAGILRPIGPSEGTELDIVYLQGDALQPRGSDKKIIAHVVNNQTQNWGGGGFASALKKKWPSAQEAYKDWLCEDRSRIRLGHVHTNQVDAGVEVASLIAQHGFGPSSIPRIRYEPLDYCLAQLATHALQTKASVHMPRIGAGLAGGDWSIIEELIRSNLISRGITVSVYSLPESDRRKSASAPINNA